MGTKIRIGTSLGNINYIFFCCYNRGQEWLQEKKILNIYFRDISIVASFIIQVYWVCVRYIENNLGRG